MQIDAPSHWRCVDFISDLHLHASAPRTAEALAAYLAATPADALFILGDLFEAWVGDDCLAQPGAFERQCAAYLLRASERLGLFIMAGNRDFLMGADCMRACGATALSDPSVLVFGAQRWLLTHGDALCLDDLPYQRFRAMVRGAAWQQEFLGQPLAQRQAVARSMRAQSENAKAMGRGDVDLDAAASLSLLKAHSCQHMVHGHTHRPGHHHLDAQHTRTVLCDWEMDTVHPRGDLLRLQWQAGAAAPELVRVNLITQTTSAP